VREVDVLAVEPGEQRARATNREPVPAHVRNTPCAQPGDPSPQHPQAPATLLALLEEQLQPDADAQDRPPGGRTPPERFAETASLELARRTARVSHAGDHGERCAGHLVRI